MGIKEYRATGGNAALLNDYHRKSDSLAQWQINFLPYKKQEYGFDYLANGNRGIYSGSEFYPYLSDNYDLRYKSVECDQNDKVVVDFGSYPKDSVIFKDKYGVKLKFTDKNILTFTGTNQADTNYIYAYHGDQKIGKLMLNVYKRKPIKVCLVMVNGAKHKESFDEIQKHLNKVFKPAVVEFEILHADFKMSELTSFSHGGSPWNSVYNEDQKRVLRAYNDSIKDGVYYLFFIDNVTDKKDGNGTPVSGYMPRGYNAGFIYDGGSPHTIAHELGHGIAGLEHVFSDSKASGKTKNLMDYADGTQLWHFQWDAIQDPSRVWMKWNKDESEGEWTTDGHYYLFTYLGMLMGMEYEDAERLGRYAEEPDSHVFSKEDKQTVIMGDNKAVNVFNNFFEEGDVLPAHDAKLNIHGQSQYSDAKGRVIRLSKDVSPLYKWNEIKLTTQDIFNGYVDIKDKILNLNPNIVDVDKKIFRLYFNSKPKYMAENTTWVIDELQQRNHALSSGYHGVELAVTAYAIKNANQLGMQQDIKSYLLHRFGDVFAHFKYEGDEAKTKETLRNSEKYTDRTLNEYIGALDNFFKNNVRFDVPKYYPYEGKIFRGDSIYQDGNMFYSTFDERDTKVQIIRFLLTTRSPIRRYKPISIDESIHRADEWYRNRDANENLVEHKTEMLFSTLMSNYYRDKLADDHYRYYYSFPEIEELLLNVIETWAKAEQNKNVMYGDEVTCISGWTSGHSADGTAPDEILRRSECLCCM